jgi:type I restriction enzyme, S subunit
LTKGIGHNRFKKTSVGAIPEAWHLGKLKDYTLKIGSGITPRGGSKVYDKKGIPLIHSQNVHFDGLRLDDVAYISESIHNEMKNSKLIEGDVLLNITGASLGRCTVVPFGFGEGNVNQHVCIIRPNSDLDFLYLSLFLSSDLGQNTIFRANHGLSREALNYEQISSFEIPLPPLKEQKMIAGIISPVNMRIQNEKVCRMRIEHLKLGLMQKLLTGKVRVKV